MANQKIQWTEEMVGENHATKADTLGRHGAVEHANDGTHLNSYASLYEYTPAGSITSITTGGVYVKWVHSVAGEVKGAPFITSSISTDSITIGASGAGIYDTFLSASVSGEAGMAISLAIFVDGVREDKLTRTVRLGGGHKHFPDIADLKLGTLNSGDVTTMQSQDATYYDIQEVAIPTGFIIDLTFHDMVAPRIINTAGRYTGTSGHEVEIQIYDADTGADEVQDGGNGYTCIRSHTSGASTQPGSGGDWTSYWELKGAASDEDAWLTATAYDDAFDEVRSDTKDMPHDTIDYTRSWIVPGIHMVRKKYSDSNNDCRIRFIHNSSGTAAHQLLLDAVFLEDDHSGASITLNDFLDLSATEELDARITTDNGSTQVITTNVNFKLDRIEIG